MSEENVEVVRRANEPRNGEDMVPIVREFVEGVTDWSDTDAVVAALADDPAHQHLHPDIEWDWSAMGLFGVSRGFYEYAVVWREWVELWESYVYEVREYRDLGDWVLTVFDARVRGRDGIPLETRPAQLWKVRAGKIVIVRVFLSEAQALEAVALER
jgi:ketosteroid isomerase-like protein